MKILKFVCVVMFVVILSSQAYSEESGRVAKIVEIEGKVEVKISGQDGWVLAQKDMVLNQGDIIKTKSNSFALLVLNGSGETAEVELDANSQLMISELISDKEKDTQKTLLDLAIGKVLIRAQKLHSESSKFEVKTPTSVVGVRGTTFTIEVEALE